MVSIFCDESCHLPNDNSPIMVLGGISCPRDKVRILSEQIRKLKKRHGVFEFAEIKWTKVSSSKLNMYKDLVDLFFEHSCLSFRAIVAKNKKSLDYERYNLTHDDWYQRMYYLLLREMVCIGNEYAIYVDIKDTKGAEKIEKLKKVLNRTLFDFYDDTVKRIQLVQSDQLQVLQLADLFIGAVSYKNRDLNNSQSKLELIDYIERQAGRSLKIQTPKTEDKFNIFVWTPRI